MSCALSYNIFSKPRAGSRFAQTITEENGERRDCERRQPHVRTRHRHEGRVRPALSAQASGPAPDGVPAVADGEANMRCLKCRGLLRPPAVTFLHTEDGAASASAPPLTLRPRGAASLAFCVPSGPMRPRWVASSTGDGHEVIRPNHRITEEQGPA